MQAFDAGATDVHPKNEVEGLFKRASQFARGGDPEISGRVLYVEDSAVMVHVMKRILEGMGLEVDYHSSAADALASFEEGRYDLVITDILVEGEMSGMGLITHIRDQVPDKIRVPVLAISGMDDQERRKELFRLGINDFVTKPVVEAEVRARVGNLIWAKQLFDRVQEQQRNLYDLAMIDQLTGLYNRNSLTEFANKTFAEANRHDLPLSLILIDIDHFKEINDTHGHLVGDDVLAGVGELLRNDCRREDFAVRFGGEELMLILPHCDLDGALQRAGELRAKLEQLSPGGVPITASLGVTARPQGRQVNMGDLFLVADRAVYQAKDEGRNCVREQQANVDPAPRPA